MKRSHIERRVNFADCDPAKIVFYPVFYRWFDRGTEELFRDVGLQWDKIFGTEIDGEKVFGVPLVETSAKYLAPCRFGDLVQVESWIETWSTKTFTVRHDVHNNGKIACQGREVRVWAVEDVTRPAGFRAAPVPAEVRALFDND